MKQRHRKIANRVLVSCLVFFSLLFLFQITYAGELSFSNDMVDNFIHFTDSNTLVSILVLIIILLFVNSKKIWQRIVLGIFSVPVGILFLFNLIFFTYVVFPNPHANVRYYFYEEDGYKYYIRSERFAAFAGSSELRFYKEKPLFMFVKHHVPVTEKELTSKNIIVGDVTEAFFKIYFSQ